VFIRRTLLLLSMALGPLVAARANERLPMTYLASMSQIHGNLIAKAASCGFAGDRSADVRRIVIAAGLSGAFDPAEGLANPETITRVRGTIRNALFAQTPCSVVRMFYDWFELVPSSLVGPWMSSNIEGSRTAEQFRIELQKRTEALVGAIRPSGQPERNPSPTH
jgi:hypothetical protein